MDDPARDFFEAGCQRCQYWRQLGGYRAVNYGKVCANQANPQWGKVKLADEGVGCPYLILITEEE